MFFRVSPLLFALGLVLQIACGDASAPTVPPAPSADSASRLEGDRPAAPRIVFLGDSLTAGLGLPVEQSYPSVIQRRLDDGGYHYEVVNAGVSGDTSAGGMRRLEWVLEGPVEVLVVALGANDGLRGLGPDDLRRNLTAIIEAGQARGLTVILAGMEAPPNFGSDYTARFREVYRDLAREHNLTLIPFLLEGVAADPTLNQGDGIHPNERGARVIADHVWRALEPALSAPESGTR